MKKRLPLIVSFVLFILLACSLAYWGQQLYKPKTRPVVAPPPPPQQEIPVEAAATVFGGKLVASTASNYQIKGVISSQTGRTGTAVVMADGQAAVTVGIGGEVAPGVTVKEIHPQFVMLLDNGVPKRVNLPEPKAGAQSEGIVPVTPIDASGSRMTGPQLPIQPPQPNAVPVQPQQQQFVAPTEPPQQPPVSPQQSQPQQLIPQPPPPPQPTQSASLLAPGTFPGNLRATVFSRHNK